jgi:hypothetical protein
MTRIALFITIAIVGSTPVAAAPFLDAAGDFLPTYTGPLSADLDVRSSEVFLKSGVFDFTATLGGGIGTTPGGFYVFGINRGAGTALFGALAPNVLFDSVVIVNNNGSGFARDLLSGVTTNLAPGAITFGDTSISALVDAALLPSAGFAPTAYTYNLWPRSPGMGTATIADFAPDNANNAITAVPEPASWALLIAGFGLVGAVARRRRTAHAVA